MLKSQKTFVFIITLVVLAGAFLYLWQNGIIYKKQGKETPKQVDDYTEFRLAIDARNNKKCNEAITHFANTLREGTALTSKDQGLAWFWRGLCEYELGFNKEADYSFKMIKVADPLNTSGESYHPLE